MLSAQDRQEPPASCPQNTGLKQGLSLKIMFKDPLGMLASPDALFQTTENFNNVPVLHFAYILIYFSISKVKLRLLFVIVLKVLHCSAISLQTCDPQTAGCKSVMISYPGSGLCSTVAQQQLALSCTVSFLGLALVSVPLWLSSR